MKKIFISLALLASAAISAQAQDNTTETPAPESNWKVSGITGANTAQTALVNWSAGGENSVALEPSISNATANYKKDKWSWDNALVTDFGMTYTTSNEWLKNVDKLNLSSKVGRLNQTSNWSISALGDLLTQFARGYDASTNPNVAGNRDKYISTLFAPGYLTAALGADYKPNDDLSVLLSPVTGKMTFVLDKKLSNSGAFGVKPGNKLLAELGASVVANYKKKLAENINFSTKLTLFTAYNSDFGNIDVNWDMMIAFKINKFLTTTLTTNLIYDDNVKSVDKAGNIAGPKVQFRDPRPRTLL